MAAVQRLRRRTGQQVGGRREFVVIDVAFVTNESRGEEEWPGDGKEGSGSLGCWA